MEGKTYKHKITGGRFRVLLTADNDNTVVFMTLTKSKDYPVQGEVYTKWKEFFDLKFEEIV